MCVCLSLCLCAYVQIDLSSIWLGICVCVSTWFMLCIGYLNGISCAISVIVMTFIGACMYTNTHAFSIAKRINKNLQIWKRNENANNNKTLMQKYSFSFFLRFDVHTLRGVYVQYIVASTRVLLILSIFIYLFIFSRLRLTGWSVETTPANAMKLCEFVSQRSLSPLHMHIGIRTFVWVWVCSTFFGEMFFHDAIMVEIVIKQFRSFLSPIHANSAMHTHTDQS